MLDIGIALLFCILSLTIGLYSSRNVRSLRQFAIGTNSFETVILIATLSATLVGGGTAYGIATKAFTHGPIFLFIVCGAAINQFLISSFFAPNVERFHGILSTGELVGRSLGTLPRILTGLLSIAISIGFATAQIAAAGTFLHYLLGISYPIAVISSTILVALYSFGGGIRSVITTDLFQFMIMIVAIPLLCSVALGNVGGFEPLYAQLPPTHLNFEFTTTEWLKHSETFCTFLLIGAFYPSYIQRLLITKDAKQAIHATRFNALISIPSYAILTIIGLVAAVMYPSIDGAIALPHMVNSILPAGLKGIAIAGLLAIVLSTADSEFNIASISFANDIFTPLFKIKSELVQLRIARITLIILASLAAYFATYVNNITDTMVASFNFWGPTIFPVVVLIFLGKPISKKAFYAGIAAGLTTFFFWNHFIQSALAISGAIPAIIANTSVLVALSKRRFAF